VISGWVDFAHATGEGIVVETLSSDQMASTVGRVCGPGIAISFDPRTATCVSRRAVIIVAWGDPRFSGQRLLGLARNQGAAAAWLALYEEGAGLAFDKVNGPYALAILDLGSKSALLATDRFSVRSLCYSVAGERLAFSDRADAVPSAIERAVDLQALYDYLYFHVIPAPRTVFRGVQRLPAGHSLSYRRTAYNVSAYWVPHFAERQKVHFEELKAEFRMLLRNAVKIEAEDHNVGCFLSGGTDSSTVTGMLGAVTGKQPRTYSIGFDAQGYDEMAYARIAARHFGADQHEYYVTPQDLVDSIAKLAAHYDQPFGNSSALPAFYCASLAKADGLDKLLAGDGGDELFGGNTRYAKQKVFDAYAAVPKTIRERAVEPLLLEASALDRLPLVGKAASYIRQARIRMPDRMNAYNLLKRLGDAEVLTPEFLSSVDTEEPVEAERRTYENCQAESLVNRMLAYDWKYTLADNDLPKVTGSTSLAGLAVGFPLLANEIVDFSLKLPPEFKVNGLRLRAFFKDALKDFLPPEIIQKKKHGFGLPFGAWVNQHPKLRELAFASLSALGERGFVRREFLRDLTGHKLAEHAAYFGEMIWTLMMLEQWLQSKPSLQTTA
jgi:asparagine synthase (glutamine-hydrolysing)